MNIIVGTYKLQLKGTGKILHRYLCQIFFCILSIHNTYTYIILTNACTLVVT